MEWHALKLTTLDDDAAVIRLVNKILIDAYHKKASDIHFESYQHNYRIRYRINGLLATQSTPPALLSTRITSRIKIMADLDIAEKRMPQDGRFQFITDKACEIHARVSTCPTVNGEKIVIRLLNIQTFEPDIKNLGFHPDQKQCFLTTLSRTQGMILVTGPTGSGKSMTLYSALHYLNQEEINICTIEDPVEIQIPGLNQVNVHQKAGITFARTLRAFLRQDPDIIMVGEIRDTETADIAIKAAMTGHLVLSTLHTNSTIETLNRLHNMGIPPLYIASSVHLIVAQRLIRRLCPNCKTSRPHAPLESLKILGIDEIFPTYQAVGCHTCRHGYQGRLGIFELLPLTHTLKAAIVSQQSSARLQQLAIQEGMITLHQSALIWVKQGETTWEEMMKINID